MQLMQMPLVMASRSKLLRDQVVLGNVVFWLGLFVGPSFLTSLYLGYLIDGRERHLDVDEQAAKPGNRVT